MRTKKWVLTLLVVGGVVGFGYYWILMQVDPASYNPRFWFPAEPAVRQIEELSKDRPRVLLPSLLEEDWDYVCIVPPYYSVGQDPKLAGVEIPWTWHEGLYTVVLKREDSYDIHPISRGKVVWFRLIGINEEAACYETTAVSIEYVEGDGPVTLRVTPED